MRETGTWNTILFFFVESKHDIIAINERIISKEIYLENIRQKR